MRQQSIQVIALDLEGTLISNAVSQFPRCGLRAFLERCHAVVPRVVIYTAVPEPRFRQVAARLVAEGHAPEWFIEIAYVAWDGMVKDLDAIEGVTASQVLLVDDYPGYVAQDQTKQWIQVRPFDHPYAADDELARIGEVITFRQSE